MPNEKTMVCTVYFKVGVSCVNVFAITSMVSIVSASIPPPGKTPSPPAP